MPIYIRDTVSMKAALETDEAAFRDAHPNGKFVYFDSETGKLVDRDASNVAKEAPDPIMHDRDADDPSDPDDDVDD